VLSLSGTKATGISESTLNAIFPPESVDPFTVKRFNLTLSKSALIAFIASLINVRNRKPFLMSKKTDF
jgi:hypothetical protein